LVSAPHARIVRDKTGYYLEDLGSTNGTFVDGRKISRIGLGGQQEIKIGKHLLDVKTPGSKDAGSDFARTMKIDRS
jgi:pSer/pThr/pTyr-binding forkhead associated (FHA) protein